MLAFFQYFRLPKYHTAGLTRAVAQRRSRDSRHPDFPEAPPSRGFFGRPTLVVFWIFVVAACLAVAIPAIPQYQLLRLMEAELADAEQEEARLKEKALRLKVEARALKKNPEYLEARARDPLRYQKRGETVIQLED